VAGIQFVDLYSRVLRWSDTNDTVTAKANVNHAYRDLVRRSRAKVTTITKTLTAGTPTYSIATDWSLADFLAMDMLSYAVSGTTQSYPLQPTSMEEIRQLRSTLATGSIRMYAIKDLDSVEFYPAPQTTGDVVTIDYVAAPTALSADSDIPSSIPEEFQILIAYGGTLRQAEDEDPGIAEQYTQKYMRGAAELKAWMRDRTGKTPRRTRVGYPTLYPRTPHDPSTYYSGGA
jgi:hypothetical protein